jgi:hypothetical protein
MTEYGMAPFYLGAPPERYVVEWDTGMMRLEFTDYSSARRCFHAYEERDT